MTTISRSVLETPTIEFKQHFPEYLKVLAQDVDPMQVELIKHPEWYDGLTADDVLRSSAGRAKLITLLHARSAETDGACLPACTSLPASWSPVPYPGQWTCISSKLTG